MSTKLGTLTLDLIAKVAGFTDPIDQARAKAGKSLKKVRDDVNTAAKAFAGLAVASAAATAAIIADSARDARELRNLADIANTGVEDFQRFALAAQTVGIEQDKLSDILKDTTDRVGDFLQTGAGPMADFFENIAPKVGVTADEFRNLSGKEALQLYVDSLNKANLSQEEMTFFLEAVASDATALIPLLKDNSKQLDEFARRADDLGLVLSELEVEQLAEIGDNLTVASKVMGVFVDKLAAQFAPLVGELTKELLGASEGAIDLDKAAITVFENIIEGVAFTVDAIDGLSRVFSVTANAMVVTFAGALDVLAGGAAKTLEIINSIPTIRLLVDDNDIKDLREFQKIQKSVARQGLDAIGSDLNSPLAGDKLRGFVEKAKARTAELEEQLRSAGNAGSEAGENSADAIDLATNAQQRFLDKIKETQDVLTDPNKSGLDALFEQYTQLAKSDIVSGSSFLQDRIDTLKQIIQDQTNAGESVDSLAVKKSIVASLEQGNMPVATGVNDTVQQEVQQLSMQSLEVHKRIEENTRALVEAARNTETTPQLRPVNLTLPTGDVMQVYGDSESVEGWQRQFAREASKRGKR